MTVLRNHEASTQLTKAASAAGFKGGELARVGGAGGEGLGLGAGAGPAVTCAPPPEEPRSPQNAAAPSTDPKVKRGHIHCMCSVF